MCQVSIFLPSKGFRIFLDIFFLAMGRVSTRKPSPWIRHCGFVLWLWMILKFFPIFPKRSSNHASQKGWKTYPWRIILRRYWKIFISHKKTSGGVLTHAKLWPETRETKDRVRWIKIEWFWARRDDDFSLCSLRWVAFYDTAKEKRLW